MRIANNIIFIAVVSLAACVEGWQRGTRSVNSNESLYESFEEDTMSNEGPSRWLRPRERDILLNKEMAEDSQGVDCCPSVAETIEPQGGRNEQGLLVELYSDHNTKQRFYELSCRPGIENKPCRFMDRKLHNQSKCIQKYSYSYAIIKNSNHEHSHTPPINSTTHGSNWTLGYIKVRSGCACVLTPKTKRKRASLRHHRNRKGRRRESDDED
ncbi:Hypothetical protein NTJ_00888 [Nesidiocoris tenuis]|uniref:Spaetzle domain-containing protein n=1 Tax=Nesidiocoris tenuis TaxID=355587 RepID=A0ABN7AA21_9HEMI|nr:Hypothetical protein NTJ_00888 [Nesidiocoris tenuis]